jgi:ParB family transcriptional regulator, chromosome partitioning protein
MSAATVATPTEPLVITVPLDALQPNPNQPRTLIDEEKLEQLTASIRARGRIIQPLVARPLGPDRYEIVCGERRWRAAKSAGLSEAPVVVRELSDDEAFEESLAENLDRQDMAPGDEVRAVARLAGTYGVQNLARRLGKTHAWVSKRKRIAESPTFLLEFVDRGGSSDIEALCELARLAEADPEAAQAVLSEHVQGGNLRDQVKAAARAARDADADNDHPDEPPCGRGDGDSAGEESFRLEDRAAAAAAADADEQDEDAEASGDPEEEKERSWLPSDAPELDEPFDAEEAVLVTAVEARRAGHLVFSTPTGPVTYELSPRARDQLQALLGSS